MDYESFHPEIEISELNKRENPQSDNDESDFANWFMGTEKATQLEVA